MTDLTRVPASRSARSASARHPSASTDSRASSPHSVSACNATLSPWSPALGASAAMRDVNADHPRTASPGTNRSTAIRAFSSFAHAFRTFARPCSESVSTTLASRSPARFARAATPIKTSNAACDVAAAAARVLSPASALSARTAASAANCFFPSDDASSSSRARSTKASLKEAHPAFGMLAAANAPRRDTPLSALASSCAFMPFAVSPALRTTLAAAVSNARRSPPRARARGDSRTHQFCASSWPSAWSTFAHTRPVAPGASSRRRARSAPSAARASPISHSASIVSVVSVVSASGDPATRISRRVLARATNSAATFSSFTPLGKLRCASANARKADTASGAVETRAFRALCLFVSGLESPFVDRRVRWKGRERVASRRTATAGRSSLPRSPSPDGVMRTQRTFPSRVTSLRSDAKARACLATAEEDDKMGRSDAGAGGSPAEDHDDHAGVARRDAHRRGARGRVMTPTLSASRRAARRILARLARSHSARRRPPKDFSVFFQPGDIFACRCYPPRVLETSDVPNARAPR